MKRFDLPVPVRFRASEGSEWHSGMVKNVSASGALVSLSSDLPVGAKLDVWLLMRQVRSSAADVVCPSVVVRSKRPSEPEDSYLAALKFRSFKFRRLPN